MKKYTVTFVLKGTQQHVFTIEKSGNAVNEVADIINDRLREDGFIEALDLEKDCYSSIDRSCIAAFKITPKS